MSVTKGVINGTGTGTTITAINILNSGSISITCNAEGRVGIRSNNGPFTFNSMGLDNILNATTGGSFCGSATTTTTFVVLAPATQRNKTVVGSGAIIRIFNTTTAEWYNIDVFTTATGTMACIATYYN